MTIKDLSKKRNYNPTEIAYRAEMQMNVKADRDREAIVRTIQILRRKGFNEMANMIEFNLNKLI